MAHEHTVTDHDKHFIIDPMTRKIMPETPEKNKLVQFDHNSERFTFEIPRYVEGHDMSLCDTVQIHYLNISSDKVTRNPGVDESHDIGLLMNNEEKVVFSWLISRNATQYSGSLNFAIRLACTTGNKVDYDWHTEIHAGVSVSNGIDNGPVIVQDYADILEEWRQKLFSIHGIITNVTLPANGWIRSPDMTYYTQDITISGATANSKIDLQPSPEQLVSMISNGVVMFVANDNGNVKVYSVNEKPTEDMIIQATVKETKI